MAKSIKKASKKIAKKVVKKAAKKAPVKKSKKPAKKTVVKAAKKASKKVVRKPVKKSATKPVATTGRRFLIIYHAPADATEQMANATPEQQAEGMGLWKTWAEGVGAKLIDIGAPLMNSKRLTSERTSSPSTKEVTGYSLLQAEDWEELMQLLEGNPHLSGWHPEATVEVHETVLMPDM